ncbi:MAG TPA: hypothetical protein PKG60_14125 [Spirochaetota bacterium]|nr:hypothetical protein [Spirochaetota bacterium]HPS86481.1 hypothetical protein [Spirochaetota bacterium]
MFFGKTGFTAEASISAVLDFSKIHVQSMMGNKIYQPKILRRDMD